LMPQTPPRVLCYLKTVLDVGGELVLVEVQHGRLALILANPTG
jgi:hypothetical protein